VAPLLAPPFSIVDQRQASINGGSLTPTCLEAVAGLPISFSPPYPNPGTSDMRHGTCDMRWKCHPRHKVCIPETKGRGATV